MNSAIDRRRRVTAIVVGCLLSCPRAFGEGQDRVVRLVVTAAVDGELAECGCRAGPQGGLARRSAFVDSLRAIDPALILLDAGGYASTDPKSGRVITDSLRAYMRREGVAATAIGDEELRSGFSPDDSLPPRLCGNLFLESDGRLDPVGRRTFLLDAHGVRVGISAVLSPTLVSSAGLDTLGYRALDAKVAAVRLSGELRAEGAELLVLLAHAPDEEVRALKWGTGFDVVVAGEGPYARRTHSAGDGAVTVYPGARGRYVAEVVLTLDDDGVKTVAGHTEGLMAGDPMRADVQRWVLSLERDLRSRRLREAARAGSTDHILRGAGACRPCHDAIVTSWSKSAHAGAYRTLEEAGMADAADCVRCHVTGFGEAPPGATDFTGVQCEACHAVPAHHPEPIDVPAVEPGECRRCHDPDNSPAYDPVSYWRRVLHD